MYSVAFLTAACLEFIMIIYLSGTLSTVKAAELPLMLLYTGIGRFIIAAGMFIAVLIPRDRHLSKHYKYFTRSAPVLLFVSFMVIQQRTEKYILEVLSAVNLSVMSIMIEFTSILLLTIVIMYYLRIYLLEQNKNMIIAISSVVLICFSHAVRILYPSSDRCRL